MKPTELSASVAPPQAPTPQAQKPRPPYTPPKYDVSKSVYTVDLLRHDRARWRMGLGTLAECEQVLAAVIDLPMYAGAVFVIRRRIRPGVYDPEPVRLLLNTAGVLS